MANPKKIEAKVIDIIIYGDQVYKILFQVDRKIPKFKAGQFLHLTLDNFDPTVGYWPESRVFSIASCSEDRKQITIVYSVKGIYTKRMESELKIGSSVWLKAPYGEFIIQNHLSKHETAVLIAGGTGVSPFIPFLTDLPEDIPVVLNYGLRNIDLMIFDEEIKKVADNEQVSLSLFLENGLNSNEFFDSVKILEGMLSIDSILSNIDNTETVKFFISGPPVMIELFKKQLIDSDISEDKIIIDEWG